MSRTLFERRIGNVERPASGALLIVETVMRARYPAGEGPDFDVSRRVRTVEGKHVALATVGLGDLDAACSVAGTFEELIGSVDAEARRRRDGDQPPVDERPTATGAPGPSSQFFLDVVGYLESVEGLGHETDELLRRAREIAGKAGA